MDRPRRQTSKAPNNQAPVKLNLKQKWVLFCVTLFCILLTVIIFAPASWLSALVHIETNGRIVLGNTDGSLWEGSGYIAVAAHKNDELTPLLPGRFDWRLSPIILLGQVELEIHNRETLKQPLYLNGNLGRIQVSPGSLVLPAARLSSFGAPLNTVKPSGEMTLSWDVLGLTFLDSGVDVNGVMKLNMENISSALSPIKPLGSYEMDFDWYGHEASLELTTIKGPVLLSGKGKLIQGRLQFSGLAQAQDGYEEDLAGLLSLLGQRRPGAGKNVIALEFK